MRIRKGSEGGLKAKLGIKTENMLTRNLRTAEMRKKSVLKPRVSDKFLYK